MESLLLNVRCRIFSHIVLAISMSLIALTARAQTVSSSFTADPTSFAAGSTVDFTWQLFGTTPTSTYSIVSLRLDVDFGDGTGTTLFFSPTSPSSPSGGALAARSFEHTYSTAGSFTAIASYASLISGTVSLFDPESGGLVPFPFQRGYRGSDTLALTSVAAPIPEPQTYAMLLAGLALLGFAKRRLGESL